MEKIVIKGARVHNLKNIDLELPKNKLIVFTGVSGSGKSSLAFDTIYAEGQRRYVESLNTYARQFLGIMDKPDVDTIEGLSPAISIDQKTTSHNPRSTVGTVTEIYDYLRLLFARIGHPHCPICNREISRQGIDQIVDSIIQLIKQKVQSNKIITNKIIRLLILSPLIRDKKGEFNYLFADLKKKGFTKVRIDGRIFDLSEDLVLIKTNKHSIDVVIDRITLQGKDFKHTDKLISLKQRISESVQLALELSGGLATISFVGDKSFVFPEKPEILEDFLFSEKFSCPEHKIEIAEIEPRTFSFNSPHGACRICSGMGKILKVDPQLIVNENLSVEQGGIIPFVRHFSSDTWFSRIIRAVADEYEINTKIPISQLPKEKLDILIHGTGDRKYKVEGPNRFGQWTYIIESFKGFANELEDRYKHTESEFIRSEIEKYMRPKICPECLGTRLRKEALGITIEDKSIVEVTRLTIDKALDWVKRLRENTSLVDREKNIAEPILKEIISRLEFLIAVGLDYLTLDRDATTLAGGEAQRIRLASQIGSGLTGVLYVLDEPTIGLHPKDNKKLIHTLKKLRDLGNTVIVVEHDREMIENADFIVDFGPGAGKRGGEIIAMGTLDQIKRSKNSLTAKYLNEKKGIIISKNLNLNNDDNKVLKLYGASQYNLKNIDAVFPLGKFICITGVSGSGKSTLLVETLYHALAREFNPYHKDLPGTYKRIEGVENINRVILIDQSPIGRTPRSNPATYTGVFTPIRQLFASTQLSRARGYNPGRFSFNVKGGRCEVCEGQGQIKIEMQFLSDVYITCEACNGLRFNRDTLEIDWKGKNISSILSMTVDEAMEFFSEIPPVSEKLSTLKAIGLGYIELGQPAPTLSGGEAQRVKLATELSKKATGRTFYILDEPTTGLHFADLEKLLNVLRQLVDRGNTVCVIEHNLDVIKNADWIIDLGPEGGEKGGQIVAFGTPQEVSKTGSYTGNFLSKVI